MAWNVVRKTSSLCLMTLFLATGTTAQDVEEQFRDDVEHAFTAASMAASEAGNVSLAATLSGIADDAADDNSGVTNGQLWEYVEFYDQLLLEADKCVPSPTAMPPITCPRQ